MASWQRGLIQGGVLKLCSSRMGAYSRGGLIRGGEGNSRIYGIAMNMLGTVFASIPCLDDRLQKDRH